MSNQIGRANHLRRIDPTIRGSPEKCQDPNWLWSCRTWSLVHLEERFLIWRCLYIEARNTICQISCVHYVFGSAFLKSSLKHVKGRTWDAWLKSRYESNIVSNRPIGVNQTGTTTLNSQRQSDLRTIRSVIPKVTDRHKKVVGLNPNPRNFLLVEFAFSPCVRVASLQELLSEFLGCQQVSYMVEGSIALDWKEHAGSNVIPCRSAADCGLMLDVRLSCKLCLLKGTSLGSLRYSK